MLTLLQACKIKTETLHNEVMTLLQISLPIVEHQREISSLKTQLVSLENSAMIPPSTTNHLTTYIPISKKSGRMYSIGAFGSIPSLFIPE